MVGVAVAQSSGVSIMNKQVFDQSWDQLRQKYGIYLRLLETIPEQHYNSHPIAGMRSPAELVVHTSGTVVRDITRGVAKGRITADESSEAKTATDLGTKTAIIEFAKQCWGLANTAAATIGDAQLSAIVPTPWNMTFPGWVGFNVLSDEFLHHRGQLYTYARACGAEPPFIWGFADNAPEFRPSH
jgi:hypothetical protein